LAEGSVWTMCVVMLDVLGEHGLKVVAAEDEHPVEAFAPEGADHALADGVGQGLSGQ
jgi:hypothetical protein